MTILILWENFFRTRDILSTHKDLNSSNGKEAKKTKTEEVLTSFACKQDNLK